MSLHSTVNYIKARWQSWRALRKMVKLGLIERYEDEHGRKGFRVTEQGIAEASKKAMSK